MNLMLEIILLAFLARYCIVPIIIIRQFFGIAKRFYHRIVDVEFAIVSLVSEIIKHLTQTLVVLFKRS